MQMKPLPFNAALLEDNFTPLVPGDLIPETEISYWLILQRNSLVVETGSEGKLILAARLPDGFAPLTDPFTIGLWNGFPLLALRIDSDQAIPSGYEALPFQGADNRLDNVPATLAGRAAQILHWQRRSRFCSQCGGTNFTISGGWGKKCGSCGEEHFPHIHPCVIVMVRRGDELLLIRNATWEEGRFSLVAGFMDFGESLEECVRREIREETGVEVHNIRYLGSQCWPFPSQLMIGFIADYVSGEAKPDGVEVVEAAWFQRGALPKSPGGKRSIARWIFDNYAGPQSAGST